MRPRSEEDVKTSTHSPPTDPRKPPATLHWKLLPFDVPSQRSKGQLEFDFAREVYEIILAEGQRGSRPLSALERNKSAAEPGLTEMVIHCMSSAPLQMPPQVQALPQPSIARPL